MNERRRALLAKFRAGSAERIRRMGGALVALREGRGDPDLLRELARELHTLKGESNMMGLTRVGAAVHAAEGLLRGEEVPSPEALALLEIAFDRIDAGIQGTLSDESLLDSLAAEIAAFSAPKSRGPTTARSAAVAASKDELRGPITAARPDLPGPPSLRGSSREVERSSAPHAAPASIAPEKAPERWVQIDARRVDELCERITGFGTDFRSLSAQLDGLGALASLASPDAAQALAPFRGALRIIGEEFDRCRARLDDITETSWSLRLSPVEPILGDLARYARELTAQQGKRVRVTVRAGGAAVERSLLDELWDPLVHLVRNAVDHGIELPEERGQKGTDAMLGLFAEPVGASVVLTVLDDGRGIDAARVRAAARARGILGEEAARTMPDEDVLDLLFTHGFSTRDTVTDLSGRGVGLDVVRKKVEAFGGTAAIHSELGRGTRFSLTLPATVSKERSLVVEIEGALYGIASRSILELIRLADFAIEPVVGGRSIRYHDEPIPLRSLARTLGALDGIEEPWAMIVEVAGRRLAFAIPRVLGELDLLRRPLDPLLAPLGYLGASSTLDDGRLVLILLLAGVVRRGDGKPRVAPPEPTHRRRRRVLVVDDAPMVRAMLADTLIEAGVEVQTADDGPAALALLDRGAPDLVLSDIDMPQMSGFDLVRNIRLRFRSLPIVMLSARSSDADRQRATAAGADAYLVKSAFNTSALLDAVTRFLGPAR